MCGKAFPFVLPRLTPAEASDILTHLDESQGGWLAPETTFRGAIESFLGCPDAEVRFIHRVFSSFLLHDWFF
jgi:hypothetical protein